MELANLQHLKVLMLNNNDLKGDFAALEQAMPTGIRFEYKNLNTKNNSVLAGTD